MKSDFATHPKTARGRHTATFVAALTVTLVVMLPALLWGVPNGADFDNHFRFAQPFFDELITGNLFPGWLAESNSGYGDPRFRFYPPLLYYLLALLRMTGLGWFGATLATFAGLSFLGAFGAGRWAQAYGSASDGVLAAIVFALMPYHLAQFFQASLLAEFAATCLLPFAFRALHDLSVNTGQLRLAAMFRFGAFYALIISLHLPTTVISSLAFGAFALLLAWYQRTLLVLVFSGAGIFIGLLGGSWYLARMLPELSWIQASQGAVTPYYDYRNNFLFSPFSAQNVNVFYGSLMAGLTVVTLLPVVVGGRLRRSNALSSPSIFNIPGLLMLVVGSFFMTTGLSRPLWAVIPKLSDVQFPYRWLTITSVCGAILCGAGLSLIWRNQRSGKIRVYEWALLLIFAGGVGYAFHDVVIDATFLNRGEFNARLEGIRGAPSFRDWLPIGVAEVQNQSQDPRFVVAGDRPVQVQSWTSHQRIVEIGEGSATTVRFKTNFYPHWKLYRLDDRGRAEIKLSAAADGALTATLPEEKLRLELIFEEPRRVYLGLLISFVTWLVSGGFALNRWIRRSSD